MKIVVRRRIAAAPAEVGSVFAHDFDRASEWTAAVPTRGNRLTFSVKERAGDER
jgi:hypothetical protein